MRKRIFIILLITKSLYYCNSTNDDNNKDKTIQLPTQSDELSPIKNIDNKKNSNDGNLHKKTIINPNKNKDHDRDDDNDNKNPQQGNQNSKSNNELNTQQKNQNTQTKIYNINKNPQQGNQNSKSNNELNTQQKNQNTQTKIYNVNTNQEEVINDPQNIWDNKELNGQISYKGKFIKFDKYNIFSNTILDKNQNLNKDLEIELIPKTNGNVKYNYKLLKKLGKGAKGFAITIKSDHEDIPKNILKIMYEPTAMPGQSVINIINKDLDGEYDLHHKLKNTPELQKYTCNCRKINIIINNKKHLVLLKDLVSGEPMANLMLKFNENKDTDNLFKMIKQYFDMLIDISSKKILIKDLHLNNILYNTNTKTIKIIDGELGEKSYYKKKYKITDEVIISIMANMKLTKQKISIDKTVIQDIINKLDKENRKDNDHKLRELVNYFFHDNPTSKDFKTIPSFSLIEEKILLLKKKLTDKINRVFNSDIGAWHIPVMNLPEEKVRYFIMAAIKAKFKIQPNISINDIKKFKSNIIEFYKKVYDLIK
ncbi:MAG: hypothetical protein GY830_01700 [Bacteroidetes bacterium]|nr:hypothetical protein [Bacteroidota bacterium]